MTRAGTMLVLPIAVLILSGSSSLADLIGQHQGANNPVTEGFTSFDDFGSVSTGAVQNDQGLNAWNITAGSSLTQAGYAQTLTAVQNQELATQGFTLSVLARVTQGTGNTSGSNFYPSSDDAADFGTNRRFDVAFGLNSNGDTEVVLPNSYGGTANFYIQGPSYTLTGSGSSYHLFQLEYNPTTQTADLYVDGVDRISGYLGQTQFYDSGAFSFEADNSGGANFNLVSLAVGPTVVPEPSTIVMTAIGGTLCLGWRWRRKRAAG